MVSASYSFTGDGSYTFVVGGVTVATGTGNVTYNNSETVVAIIPPGQNYTSSGNIAVLLWAELY